MLKKVLIAAGVAAVAAGAWLLDTRPVGECIRDVVSQDQLTDRDTPYLVQLGQAAQKAGNGQAPLARGDFFACTRIKALSWGGPSEDIKTQAYRLLRSAPSFEYGRQLARVPLSVEPAAAQATARLMRAATSLAEGYDQLKRCPAVGGDDRAKAVRDYEMLAEPYLTAIIWNMRLAATTEAAHQDAQNIFVATSVQAANEPVSCDDARFSTELETLRRFKQGALTGLPCKVELDNGEPVLTCN